MASLAYDIVISRPTRLEGLSEDAVGAVLRELDLRAASAIRDLGVDDIATARYVDMRYVGQGHEVTVAMPDSIADSRSILRAAFEARYRELFGRIIPGAPIEIVSWQVKLQQAGRSPSARAAASAVAASPAAVGRRRVFETKAGSFIEYAVYERSDFTPGAHVAGPALIVEDETTTVATSSFTVRVDARHHLILERATGQRGAP
jgi:N-methylhydantoinase A